MMSSYVLITDSACDLPASLAEELDIEVVPLSFTIDGQTYFNYLDNREMSPDELTRRQRAGAMATTNAINVGQATDAIEPFLRKGKDVLILAFSSGLSTTCNWFQTAAAGLAQEYPERKIYVVDTLCASMGEGLLVYLAARLRQKGEDIETVRNWAEAQKLHICHWFTVNDLFYLKKGGRVSAATALVGTMLQVKPVLHVDNKGCLINVSTARGRKASLKALANKIEELAISPADQTMFISHTASYEEADQLATEIKKRYGVKEVVVNHIGPVITAHTGPGCMAVFFVGKNR